MKNHTFYHIFQEELEMAHWTIPGLFEECQMTLESIQPGYPEYLTLNSEHQYEICNCDLVDESEKEYDYCKAKIKKINYQTSVI